MMTVTHLQQGRLLTELLDGLVDASDAQLSDLVVTGVAIDTRLMQPGNLFIAMVGERVDGRDFISQAITLGAVAVVVSEKLTEEKSYSIPVVYIEGVSRQLSEIAGRFYGHPSSELPVLAVTGTNGKTSCTQFMMQLLNGVKKSCGVLGTLGIGVDGDFENSINTTPDAISVQKHIAQWRDDNVDCVAMEVSSHGLEQGRVEALAIDVAVFTNLSRDHLDYHGDMESYGAAKARLFHWPYLKAVVLNADDMFSARIQKNISQSQKIITYSLSDSAADVVAEAIQYGTTGMSAVIKSPWGRAVLNCSLLGDFNLSNLLAAISGLSVLGHSFSELVAAAENIKPVTGRMELITLSDVSVVVDYSHTPDALEKALKALRIHTSSQLHCVFGCGGDRDQGKRPLMGGVAERLADVVWLTSDNPRHEPIDDILAQVKSGINVNSSKVYVEADRATAIERAVLSAKPGDVILLAGKGHEDYQQLGDKRLPFNDAVQARLALQKRAAL